MINPLSLHHCNRDHRENTPHAQNVALVASAATNSLCTRLHLWGRLLIEISAVFAFASSTGTVHVIETFLTGLGARTIRSSLSCWAIGRAIARLTRRVGYHRGFTIRRAVKPAKLSKPAAKVEFPDDGRHHLRKQSEEEALKHFVEKRT